MATPNSAADSNKLKLSERAYHGHDGGTATDHGCQAVGIDLDAEVGVSFQISYRDPSSGAVHHLVVSESIRAGRAPSGDGLILSSAVPDQTISSNAVLMAETEGQVVVRNTSSYAEIEVQRSADPMKLQKGEELKLTGEATIIVPGRIFNHKIMVNPDVAVEVGTTPTGTTSFLPSDYELPPERKEVLAHLCAPIFYPDRFSTRQTSSDISMRIQRRGTSVTPKEVNNKIQRTKDSVEEKCLTELNNRDELAAFLVTHKLIIRRDIQHFVLGE